MARAKTKPLPEAVPIQYDLHELPTAQHRAGLAGLLLQLDSMAERQGIGILPGHLELPKVIERGRSTVTILLSETSTVNLFDDLYDAEVVERPKRQKRRGMEPKRTIEVEVKDQKTKKLRKEKRFIYDEVQPIGQFLRRYTDGGKESWHHLWQDMLLAIPRNQDATMGPFKDMAQLRLARGGEAEWNRMVVTRRKNDTKCFLRCREGLAMWEEILRHENSRRGEAATIALSGALLIGSQDKNAERLEFSDRIDHALLLHFWPNTVRIFVPEVIDPDGQRQFAGFVLAIPDVRDLPGFCRAYKGMLGDLSPKLHLYRPADAVISLPDQGALEFMRHLADLAERKVLDEGPSRYVVGVEFIHLVRTGQNVKIASHGRVPPRDALLYRYDGIRKEFRNPVFLSAYLQAVLRGRAWFAELDVAMAEREWSHFIHSTQEKHRTPPAMIGFAWEAHRRFQQIEAIHRQTEEGDMSASGRHPADVDRIIYKMIGQYVHLRTLMRLRMEPDDPKKPWMKEAKGKDGKTLMKDGKPVLYETADYQDERRKVCSTLFLELRSRNDRDFVEHFSATLASVPQKHHLVEDDYALVAAALMRPFTHETGEDRPRTREDVKTLTMLALSAHSRSLFARNDANVNNRTIPQETEE